ncbi:MAG: TetR/AcrR family transcriptional regulator [Actinomycetota bacterium]
MVDAPVDARVVRTHNDVLAAAIDVLIEEGWDAVTQPRVARRAGYAKATVYSHWPDRLDLLRDAFQRFGEIPHHEPVGDVRADMLGELRSYRRAMVEHRLDRVLAILAERATEVEAAAELRDQFVDDGMAVCRSVVATVLSGVEARAASAMMGGALLHAVLLEHRIPDDEELEIVVDTVLRGFDIAR